MTISKKMENEKYIHNQTFHPKVLTKCEFGRYPDLRFAVGLPVTFKYNSDLD